MGCKSSKPFIANSMIQGQDQISVDTLFEVGFAQDELNKYYEIFNKINEVESDVVLIKDIIKFAHLNDSKLVRVILKFFDTDDNGGLDFLEFCCAIWNFLSIAEMELSQLMFFLITRDLEGEMTAEVFKGALELLTGKKLSSNPNVKQAFDVQCNESNSVIKLSTWINFNVKYSFTLSNIKVMQVNLGKVIFGQSYWDNEIKKRKKDPIKSKFKYVIELTSIVKENIMRSKKEAEEAKARQNIQQKRSEHGLNGARSSILVNQTAILGTMGMDAQKNSDRLKRQGVDAISDAQELDKQVRDNRQEKAKSSSFDEGSSKGGTASVALDGAATAAGMSPKRSIAERTSRKVGGLAAKAG